MLMALMLVPFASRAQVTEFPYSCDFEDATEASAWTFVNGSLTNQWVLGTAANNTTNGSYGIYISNDAGTTAAYTVNSAAVVYAYREFYLTPGDYYVSFDWKGYGESTYDYLLAALVESSVTLTAGTSLPSGISNTTWTAAGWTKLGPTSSPYKLNLSSTWNTQIATFTITTAGTYRIVFVWRNDTSSGTAPGACVDNVVVNQITCPAPTNLLCNAITTSSLNLTWTETGSATSWLIYANGEYVATANSTSYTLSGLQANSLYSIDVRSFCSASDTSLAVTGTFRTACPATLALPYAEQFNGYSGFPSYPYYGPAILPACWDYYSNGTNTAETSGSTAYYGGVAQYSSASYGAMEANNPYLYLPIQLTGSAVTSATYLDYQTARGDTRYAVFPEFATALNGLQISFDYKMSSAYSATGTAAVLEFGYVTEDTSTFVSIWSANAVTTTQTVEELNLSTLAAQAPEGARLAFKFSGVHNGTGTYSYSNVACGIDNILVEELPSCTRVSTVTVTGVTSSSISVAWVDEFNADATYNVYTIVNDDTTFIANVSGNAYTVTGLSADAAYTIGIATVCGNYITDLKTVNGRTACVALTADDLPYTENFEDYGSGSSAVISYCWTKGSNSTTAYPYPSTTAATGSRSLYFYSYLSATSTAAPTYSYAALPELAAGVNLNGLTLTFNGRRYSSSGATYRSLIQVGVMTDPTDVTTFQAVETINMTPLANSTIQMYEVNLAGYQGQGRYVAFLCPPIDTNASYIYNYIYIDDVVLDVSPSCMNITSLAAADVQSNTVTLTWADANNTGATYTVYDMSDTNSVVIATGIQGTTYTVTNLSPVTAYTFGVKANCADGDANNIITVSCTTKCAAVAVPYSENFDSLTTSTSSTTNVHVDCWEYTMTNSSYQSATYQPQVYYSSTYANSGNYSLRLYGVSYTCLPPLAEPLNTLQLTFSAYTTNTSYKLAVGVMEGNTFVPIDTLDTPTSTHNNFTVYFSSYTGNSRTIAFRNFNTSSTTGYSYHYIDDVVVDFLPSCAGVTNLTATTTSNSATLTWVDDINDNATYTVSDATGSPIAYGIQGTTYTVTDLSASTDYTFYVTADCSETESGDAVSVSTRTQCATETMPWSENFNDWTAKSTCWSFLTGAYNMGNGTPTTTTGGWALQTSYGSYITIDGKALGFNLYSANRYWAVTPNVAITSDNAMFSVDVAVSAWSAATPNYDANDTLAIAISINGGASYTNLAVYDYTQLNALSGTYTTLNVPVLNYNGQTVRFAIFGGSTSGTSPYDNRIVIDNVSVAEPPACAAVTGLTTGNITSTGATLTWNGDANSYDIYIVNGDTTNYIATVTDTTFPISNLLPQSTYTYGVIANCGPTVSDMVTVNFTTACAAMAIPFTENFENGISCWSVINGTSSTGISSGAFRFYYGYEEQYLISPELSGTTDGMTLSFLYKIHNASYPESFQVGYSTTTDSLDAFTWGTEQTNLTNTDYQLYSEILPAGIKYVSVKYTAIDMWSLYIDSMVFALPPSCMPVTNLQVSDYDATSVSLSWNGTANAYNVYNGQTLVATVNTTSYTVTGLTAATGYTFSVTAVCGNDESPVETVEARTACANGSCYVYIYAEDSYGDGWSGSTLTISQNGAAVATYSMADQDLYNETIYDTFAVEVCSGTSVYFSWTSNCDWDYEASFTIVNAYGNMYSVTDASELTSGIEFFTVNDACAAPVEDSAVVFITVNDSTMGTTNPAPGSYTLFANDSIVITGMPNDNYELAAWVLTATIGDIPQTDTIFAGSEMFANPLTISLTENSQMTSLNVMALFEAEPVVCLTPSMTIDAVNGRDVTFSWTTNAAAYAVQVSLLDIDGEPVFDTMYGPAGTQTLHFDETFFDAGTAYIGMTAICGDVNYSDMVIDTVVISDPIVEDSCMTPMMTIDGVNGRDVTFSWTTNAAAYAVEVALLDADGEAVFDTIYGPAGTQTLHFDETLFDAGTAYIGMLAVCDTDNTSIMVIDSVVISDPIVEDSCLAISVEIGDVNSTTSTYSYPVNNYYNNTLSETIIDAGEIGGPMKINSLGFYYAGSSASTNKNDVTIYVKPTTKNVFASSNDIEVLDNSAVMVYSGALNCSQGWNDFTFTTPYIYNGQDNLMVIVDDNSGAYNGSNYTFKTANCNGYRTLHWYSDSNNPDPSSPDSFSGSKSYANSRVVMRLNGCDLATCHKPVVSVDAVTSNSVTLSWTGDANSYNLYNLGGGDGFVANVTANTYTFTGLNSNTLYNFAVEGVCTADDHSTMATVSVRTACGAITELPYTMDFEVEELQGNSNNYERLPWCWERITDSAQNGMQYPYSVSGNAHGGSRSFYFYGGTDWQDSTYPARVKVMLPLIDASIPVNTLRVNVWAKLSSSNQYGYCQLSVGQLSSTGDIIWINSAIIDTTAYVNYNISLSAANPGLNQLVLGVERGFSVYVDELTIETIPSCPDVADVTLEDISFTGASVSWNNVNATSYQVEVRQNGAALTDVTIVVVDTTATISGLTADNNYQVVVRSVCGNDFGSWSYPLDIYTGYCMPTPTSVDGSGITSVSFGGMTNTTHPTTAGYANYSTMAGSVPAGTPATVEITYSTGTTTVYSYGTIIWVDWDNSLSFEDDEIVYTGMSAQGSNGVPQVLTATFDIPGTTPLGNYRMRIVGADSYFDSYVNNGTGNHNPCFTSSYAVAEDYTLTVTEAPSCMIVTGLTATPASYSVTLNWTDANNDGATYSVYDMYDSSLVATGITGTTYTVTGLNANTAYTFGVVSNCAANVSSDMVTVSTTTLVSCPAPTALTATLTPGVGTEATLSWTVTGEETAWQICLNEDTNTLIDVTTNPYTLTGLTAETIYTAKVRAFCDVDDQSTWSNTVTFEPTVKTVIGSGTTTNQYLPTYTFYNYSLTQQIYTAAELGTAGLIESIDFYNASSNARTRTLDVYVVSTNKTSFSDGYDWITVSAADLQYSGSVTFAANSWSTINLDGFVYDGQSNIAIIVDDNTGTYESGVGFKTFDATSQAIRIYSDPTNYDPTAPSSYSGTVLNVKNQIRLVKSELSGCVKPTSVNVAYNGGTTAIVSWNSDATAFNMSINGVVTYGVNNPDTITGLDLATNYTIMVQANCGNDTSEWTNPITFTTDMCMPDDQCQLTFDVVDSYGDSWNGAAIVVTDVLTGAVIGQIANANLNGTSGSGENEHNIITLGVCSGRAISFSWVSGQYDSEASFEIKDGSGAVVYTGAGSNLTSGAVFFTLNDPCPTCQVAADLTVDTVTTNSVTISWTGTAASYDVYNGTTMVANVTANTYTFTGLTAATSYTFGVQAICSATDTASLATINVMTECDDITTLPYMEGFENGLGCWTTVNGSADGMPWYAINSADYAHTGVGFAASFSYYNYSSMHADAWLISPKFVLPTVNAGDTLNFSWWYRVDGGYPLDLYDVMLSTTTDDTTAFTTTLLAVIPDSTNGEYTQMVVDLTAYAGQSIYLAFHHHDSYDQDFLMIDDITLSVGAAPAPVPDTLTVTFAVNDATMGTTIPAPGTYQYLTGDTVRFNATSNSGYHFVAWVMSYGNNQTDTITYQSAYATSNVFMTNWGNVITLTALFEAGNPDSTTITYAVNDATMGSITPAPGTYTIYVGDAIQASATPNAGYRLDAWVLDVIVGGTSYPDTIYYTDDDFENPINFGTVPQNYVTTYNATFAVTAIFAPDIDSILVNVAVNNATMGTTDPTPGAHYYYTGDTISVVAVPFTGYQLQSWTMEMGYVGYGILWDTTIYTSALSDVFYMAFDEVAVVESGMSGFYFNATASFVADTTAPAPVDTLVLTMAVNDSTMGTTTPAPGTYTIPVYDTTSTMTFLATANAGYHLEYWLATGVTGNGTTDTDTLPAPDAGQVYSLNYYQVAAMYSQVTLTAYFAADPLPLPDSMMVTIAVNDATMGTTNPAPGTHYFYEGDTAHVYAIPNNGYHLTGWSFIMNYNGVPYYDTTINVAVNDFFDIFTNGWVVESGDDAYSFSVTANFAAGAPELDTVTVNITVTNPAEGTTNPAPGTVYFTTGDTLSLIAMPFNGYSIAGWNFSLYTADTTYYNNLTVPNPVDDFFSLFGGALVVGPMFSGYTFDVTPVFSADTTQLTYDSVTVITAVNDASMGTVTPAPGVHRYGVGDSIAFSATAFDGYHMENVHVEAYFNGIMMFDTTLTTDISSLNVVVDSTILGLTISATANFAADSVEPQTYYTVTVSSHDTTMGTVSPEGSFQVLEGDSFTVTATPLEGYQFVAWKSGDTYISADMVFTFTVQTNIALEAYFMADTAVLYQVVGMPNDSTMGYVTGSCRAVEGQTVTLTAFAYQGYRFDHWSTGETTATINIQVETEDITVIAYFVVDEQGIEDADENEVAIYSTDSKIIVRGAEGSSVYVFDITGRMLKSVASASELVEFHMSTTGVYLVKVDAAPAKRVLVVR